MSELIFRNSIVTPDGTELISQHRHDYVLYTDANGQSFGIDGGNDYLRRTHDAVLFGKDTSITSNSPIEDIRGFLSWGTYGKEGKSPYKRVLLKDMSNNHILAIIETQKIHDLLKEVFYRELDFRKNNDIYIED